MDVFETAVATAEAARDEGHRLVEPTPPRGVLGWNKPGLPARRVYARWGNKLTKADDAYNLANAGMPPFLSLWSPEVTGAWAQVASSLYDTEYEGFIRSLPPCDLAIHHEPENDPSMGTSADFRAAFDHVAGMLPPWVRPVACLMLGTFATNSVDAWLPSKAEALAVDAYNWWTPNGSTPWRSPFELMTPVLAYDTELPLLVWETNCKEDPANPERKADWLRLWGDLAAQEQVSQLVFFDGDGWSLLSSQNAQNAVTQLASLPYFGGV